MRAKYIYIHQAHPILNHTLSECTLGGLSLDIQLLFRNAIMHSIAKLFGSCFVATLISRIVGAPTGAALPLSIPTGQAIGPPGSSGDAYGSEKFLGPNGNPVNPADSAIVTNYDLVPGQTADADLGLYLDLEEAANPQPIRGSQGGTDPGPRITKLPP